jgi:hypothetical protein
VPEMHSAVCNAHMRLPSQAHGGTGCYGGIQSSCSRRAAMGCRGSSSSSSSPTSSLWFLRGAVEGTWASRPAIIHAPSTSRDWLTCSHLLCLLCRCQGVATYQITYRKCACSLSGLANNSTSPKHSPTRPPAPSLQDLRSDEASFTHVPLFPQRGLFQLWLSQRKTPKNMASFQTPGSAFSVRWCRSERNIRPLPSGEW